MEQIKCFPTCTSKNIGVHNLMETLFMDSTDVLNKYGFEDVNYSFKFKNKKATRVM